MLGSNQVNNPALLAMMRANEQAQRGRMQRMSAQPLLAPRRRPEEQCATAARGGAQAPSLWRPKEQGELQQPTTSEEEMRSEAVPLTADEAEWLAAAALRQGHPSASSTLNKLLQWANGEPPAAKKKIFLVIRCRRCSAGARGGVKENHQIQLPIKRWQWLKNVQERCGHASMAKTVRIIIDFYMPMCQADPTLERQMLRVGCEPKTGRHAEAVGNVDPLRAPRGRPQTLPAGRELLVPESSLAVPGTPKDAPKLERVGRRARCGQAPSEADIEGASTVDGLHESDSDATQGGSAESSAADALEEPAADAAQQLAA